MEDCHQDQWSQDAGNGDEENHVKKAAGAEAEEEVEGAKRRQCHRVPVFSWRRMPNCQTKRQ